MPPSDPKSSANAQRDIANQLQRQLDLTSEINKAYDVTLSKITALANVVKAMGADELEKSVGTVNKTTQGLTATMKDVGQASNGLFDSIIKSSSEATVSLEAIGAGATGGALLGVGLAFKAVTSLVEGFYNVLKSITDIVTGVVKGLFNITKAILSIPFKIYQGLVDMSNKVAEALTEAARSMEGIRKEFGSFKGPLSSAVVNVTERFENFKKTGLSTWQVFGNLAQRIDYVREVSAALGAAMGIMTTEFKENGGAILGFQKGLGLTAENLRGIADQSIALGKPVSKTLKEMTKQAVELGKSFGVDSKIIGRDVGKAIQDVGHFGGATNRQIGQAVVYARKLGIELEKITGTLSAFETFDTAAENSAKLAQSFGVLTDAFSLMSAQSPDEQVDSLRKAFSAAGKSTESMTRQELKLLSQTTGLDEATAKLVFSQKNQGIGLDQIKKKAAQAETAEVTQAKALKSIAENIERIIRQTPEFTGFFDAFMKGMGRGIVTSGVFRKGVFNLRESLVQTWRAGAKLGKEFVKAFPGVKTMMEGIAELFQPAKFKKLTDGIVRIFSEFFHEISEGRYSFSVLMSKLKNNFFNFLDKEAPAGRKILSGLETFMSTIGHIVLEGAKFFIKSAGELMIDLAQWIKDPNGAAKAFASAQAGGAAAGGVGAEIIKTIQREIFNDEVLGTFVDGLGQLFDAVMEKIEPQLAKMFNRMVYRAFGSGVISQGITNAEKNTIEDAQGEFSELYADLGKKLNKEYKKTYEPIGAGVDAGMVLKRRKFLESEMHELVKYNEKLNEIETKGIGGEFALAELKRATDRKRQIDSKLRQLGVDQGPVVGMAPAQIAQAKQQAKTMSEIQQNFKEDPKKYSESVLNVSRNIKEATMELKSLSDDAVKTMFSKLQAIDKIAVPLGDGFGKRLEGYVSGINSLKELDPRGFSGLAKVVKDGQLDAALTGLKQMVATANELQEALGKGNANQFDLSVPLKNVANGVGLGAKQNYQIKNKDFVINLNLTVTMNAGAVEKVILQRQDSIIRDRLQNASYKGTSSPPDIPSTPNSPSPAPIGPIVK